MGLFMDMHRLGPAPTRERELAAAAANLVFMLVASTALLLLGRPAVAGVLALVMLAWIVGRLDVARRRDRRAEASR